MSREIVDINLERLNQYNRILYDKLQEDSLVLEERIKVYVEDSMDQNKIVRVSVDGKRQYLNSCYEPMKAASIWAAQIDSISYDATIVLFGLGNGMYLKSLLDRSKENVQFIVYEPSKELFKKVMEEIDFGFLDERVHIVVKGINDFLFPYYLTELVRFYNFSVCHYLEHPNYLNLFLNELVDYLDKVKYHFKMIEVNKNTDIYMGELVIKNVLRNTRYIFEASVIDQLINAVGRDIPADVPAIIVSAGPSLVKNVKTLKKAKGKSFIFATDTSLNLMLSEGIIPDAFAIVDPDKNMRKFIRDEVDTIPMFAMENAKAEALEKHKGKKIFMNDAYGYGNVIYRMLNKEYKTREYGGSVATVAFTCAVLMKFKTIIFVGQDLAYTDSRRHAVGTLSDEQVVRIPENHKFFPEVEDIYGGMVKTTQDYKLYLEWFENNIKLFPDIQVIDATEGGAKIHGTKIEDLETTIERECKTEFSMEDYLENLPPLLLQEEKKQAQSYIATIDETLQNICGLASEGVMLYESMNSIVEEQIPDKRTLSELNHKISTISKDIESRREFLLISAKIKQVEYDMLKNLVEGTGDAIGDIKEAISRGKIYMQAIQESIESLLPEFEKMKVMVEEDLQNEEKR